MKKDTSSADQRLHTGGAAETAASLDLIRLNRREFLRGGALAVAGAATLSGAGLIHPRAALAQQPGGGGGVEAAAARHQRHPCQ